MLRVSDVAFGYVPEQTLFKDVSFTIESGEFLAVGGRNGCGKTTITRLLVGLETPRTGRIFTMIQILQDGHQLNEVNILAMCFSNLTGRCFGLR